jgi:xanthine dehydrogenase YagS FAD-binding subunit
MTIAPLPSTAEAAATVLTAGGGEFRAGGTDVEARRRLGRATGPFVDLREVTALRGITWRADGSARIGAMTSIAEIAADDRLAGAHPAVTATAGGLATPQIRAAGTLGGNLLQRNRCWYYRSPRFSCHQSGGDGCPARDGLNHYSAIVEQGPCVAPHASSMAMALVASDATVTTHGGRALPAAELYDGSDPTRDHVLPAGEVLTAVDLGAPVPGERAAYFRAIGRAEAEWPLVEAVARLVVTGGSIGFAAVAAGGIARTPVRLTAVERELTGRPVTASTLRAAAGRAADGCVPLRDNGYKVGLLCDTVLEVLERAAG